MSYKCCPLCGSLILEDGHCRNKHCKMHKDKNVSQEQIVLINNLYNKLGIESDNDYISTFTEKQANKLIKSLYAELTIKSVNEV